MRSIRKIRFFALILIPALLWIFYNNAANWHYHRLEFGLFVNHAHSYDKSDQNTEPVQNHNHNNQELLIFDQISHLLLVLVLLSAIPLAARQLFVTLAGNPLKFYFNTLSSQSDHVRGPPNVML